MVKRVNYFDGQFLRPNDFIDEQSYHIGMRQKHNSLLHTWGVADGLVPSAAAGAPQVTVSPGFAIDMAGHEIELDDTAVSPPLNTFSGKSPYVTIAWNETPSDPSTEAGAAGNTRVALTPVIGLSEAPNRGKELILGKVTVDAQGGFQSVDTTAAVRTMAGVKVGDLNAISLSLTGLGIDPTAQPRFSVSTAGQVDLQGSLQVAGSLGVIGSVGIGTMTPQAPLDVSGATPNEAQAIFTRGADTKFQLYAANGASNEPGAVQATFGLRYAGQGDVATLSFMRGAGAADASVAFNTQASERMRIDSAGNVGIGTTTPLQKLDVSGGIGFSGTSLNAKDKKLYSPADGDLEWMTNNAAGAHGFAISQQGAKAVYLNTSGSSYLNGGNVGIGTPNPNASLHLKDSGASRVTLRIQSAAGNTANAWGGIGFSGEDGNAKGAIIFQSLGTTYSRGNLIFALNSAEDATSAGPANAVMTLTAAGRIGIGPIAPASTFDIGGNVANNVQAIFTRGQDANFQLYAANGASNAENAAQAVFGLRYAGTGDSATLSFIRGGGGTDASLAFNTNGQERLRINSAGSLVSPKWRVTQVMNQAQGSLPKSGTFASGGGTLMIIFSGSGRSTSGARNIGMTLQIDGREAASANCCTNENESHKAFTGNTLVQANVAAGNHTINLVAIPNTVTDVNDFFSVTVLELPF